VSCSRYAANAATTCRSETSSAGDGECRRPLPHLSRRAGRRTATTGVGRRHRRTGDRSSPERPRAGLIATSNRASRFAAQRWRVSAAMADTDYAIRTKRATGTAEKESSRTSWSRKFVPADPENIDPSRTARRNKFKVQSILCGISKDLAQGFQILWHGHSNRCTVDEARDIADHRFPTTINSIDNPVAPTARRRDNHAHS
jgi:hypothetical protein